LLEAARLIGWLPLECQVTQVAQVKVEDWHGTANNRQFVPITKVACT